MICGHGINDMQWGWILENEWNKKIYEKWADMIKRCCSEIFHKK